MLKKLDIDELEVAKLAQKCKHSRQLLAQIARSLSTVYERLRAVSEWFDDLGSEILFAEECEE